MAFNLRNRNFLKVIDFSIDVWVSMDEAALVWDQPFKAVMVATLGA